jgi:hypothetical protein
LFPIIHCSSAQPHRYSLLGWASGLNGRLRPCLARRWPLISSAGSPDTTPSLHSPPSPALFPSLASPSSSAELLSCTLNGPQRPELKARAHPNDALPCLALVLPSHNHTFSLSRCFTHVATLGSRALCRFHPFDTLALSSTAKHSSRHSFTLESWEFLLRFRFRTTSLSQAAASASLHVASTRHAPLIDQVTEIRRPFLHP